MIKKVVVKRKLHDHRNTARIDLPHLLWALDGIASGQIVNRITVPQETAADARIALQRMIDIKPVTQVTKNP